MEITPNFKLFWYFASERQNIFFKRLGWPVTGQPGPWTTDPILQKFKFTNAYRASDRVSQYLIRNVVYDGLENVRLVEDTFFRIMLFKIFNLPETWERLTNRMGKIGSGIQYDSRTIEEADKCLTECINKGIRINSNAYMMTGSGSKGQPRHRMYLQLLEQIMKDKLPLKISLCPNMETAFKLIRSYRLMGDFLAYQYITDINYSSLTNFTEMDFTVAGPGSLRGIEKCFKGIDFKKNPPAEVIRYMAEHQDDAFKKFGYNFQRIGDRPLQLIDIQNLFCELDKYTRATTKDGMVEFVEEGKRIKNTFEANPKPIQYFYPPKWGVNLYCENIRKEDWDAMPIV
jgi:hypothetical protein